MERPRIGVVFPIPKRIAALWPSDDFDFEARKRELTMLLESSCSDIDFVPVGLHDIEETENFLKGAEEFDGFVIYFIGGGVVPFISPITPRIAKTRKPMILVDDLYSGQLFLFTYPQLREAGFPVVGIASANFEDVIETVKLFKVIEKMKKAKILLLIHKERGIIYYDRNVQECASMIKQLFGTEVVRMGVGDFIEKYLSRISGKEAEATAQKWMEKALKVVEPTREDLIRCASLYHGLKKAIEDIGAAAFTTDVPELWHYITRMESESGLLKMFGLDRIREPNKYWPGGLPCLAYLELNNEGVRAVCESDIEATVTTLLLHYLAEEISGDGIPGFTAEPVVDLSNGLMIYGHCTGPSRVFGSKGPENPFIIRSHSESHQSASVQSLLPIEQEVTVARLDLSKKVLVVHGGTAVANSETLDVERGCRTKLAVKIDVEKVMTNWTKKTRTWHRTLFYGDWREPLKNLATLLGIEVFEEDKT